MSKTNNILIKYTLKAVLSTIISVLLLSFVFSKISYSLDLDLKVNMIFTIFICVITAAVTAFISVNGIKNNGALLGAIAQIPLIFYSFLNVIFNENTLIFFAIKAVAIIFTGILIGYLTSKRSGKLRLG